MAEDKDKIVELEIKFAIVQNQLIHLLDDNRRLLEEVTKLSESLTEMQLSFSKGRGVIIGLCLFAGSVFTLINQYLGR